jgi:glycosyltransferase involved in cell wall biosynthesis
MLPNNFRILNISLDRSMLTENSPVVKRIISYSGSVEKYTVLVPAVKQIELKVSDKLKIVGVAMKNKIIGLWKVFRVADNLIKSDKYGLISVQDQYYLGLVGWLLARKHKIGLEIQVHGFEKEKGLRKIMAQFVLPKAGAVRTVSKRLQKKLVENYKVDINKITVVPIFVDLSGRVAAKQKLDKFIFLTVCRLVPVKNIELQIKAVAELVKVNSAVELWIVGDGPEKVNLENKSKKLGVAKYVKFLGWQADTEKFYNQADVFLLTSFSEGWPLVIVEAAQYGLPIIMTDVGSAGELVVNNVSGLIVPTNDVTALAEAIKKLVADNNLRQKLGVAAQQKASQLLSWQDTLKLYQVSWEMAVKMSKS